MWRCAILTVQCQDVFAFICTCICGNAYVKTMCCHYFNRETRYLPQVKPRSRSWMPERRTASWWRLTSHPDPKQTRWGPGGTTCVLRRCPAPWQVLTLSVLHPSIRLDTFTPSHLPPPLLCWSRRTRRESFLSHSRSFLQHDLENLQILRQQVLFKWYNFCAGFVKIERNRQIIGQNRPWKTFLSVFHPLTQLWSPCFAELSVGAWVGVFFILMTALIFIVTLTVLCCKCRKRQRQQSLGTSQMSAPI